MKICHLIDVPQAVPVLAAWFVEEWRPYYGPDGPGDAEDDLRACMRKDALPICLVALDDQGDVLGTAALKHVSVGSDVADGPWLAAFLVGQAHRDRGVGTALVGAIEDAARDLGFDSVYTSTDGAGGIVERCGWRLVGDTQSLRGEVGVYCKTL